MPGVFIECITYRQYPKMALIKPSLFDSKGRDVTTEVDVLATSLQLDAPGQMPLVVSLEGRKRPVKVTLWDSPLQCGELIDQGAQEWLRKYLGVEAYLVQAGKEYVVSTLSFLSSG